MHSSSLAPVAHDVRLLIAELNQLKSSRLPFRITHRYRLPGTECAPGEEVLAICFTPRGNEHQLPLSPALLLLGDYLLRNKQFGQTASQIEAGIDAGSFYSEQYATNARGRRQRMRRISRSAIREYVRRLHEALAIVFEKGNLRIDPRDVLTEEKSVGNQVLYRWNATVEVVHHDLKEAYAQPLR
jgi:hypothetical protein